MKGVTGRSQSEETETCLMVDTVIVENVENEAAPLAVIWPAVLAGAAVPAALSLMMLTLGSRL